MQKIAQNGGMYQQMMAMQQQMLQMAAALDSIQGTNMAGAMMNPGQQEQPQPAQNGASGKKTTSGGESSVTKNARQRVADAGVPT